MFFLLSGSADRPFSVFRLGGVAFDPLYFVWGCFIGLMVACVAVTLIQMAYGRFLDAVRRAEAFTPDTAKTLAELGLSPKKQTARMLRNRTSLMRKYFSLRLPDGRIIAPAASLYDEAVPKKRQRTRERDLEPFAWEKAKKAVALPPEAYAPPDTPFKLEEVSIFIDDIHRFRAENRFGKRDFPIRRLLLALILLGGVLAFLSAYCEDILFWLENLLNEIFGGYV